MAPGAAKNIWMCGKWNETANEAYISTGNQDGVGKRVNRAGKQELMTAVSLGIGEFVQNSSGTKQISYFHKVSEENTPVISKSKCLWNLSWGL